VCSGGRFASTDKKPALNACLAKIKGSFYLGMEFSAEGAVELTAATVEGDLICDGGEFVTKDKRPALQAMRTRIKGLVRLCQGFKAEGEVRLQGATIEGDLVCEGSQFCNKGQERALDANGAKIGRSVLLRNGMTAEGEVCFSHAQVARNFQWWGIASPEKATLDLSSAKVGTLMNVFHDKKSWPNEGNLFLDGFVYYQFDDRVSQDVEVQLQWLHLQKRDTGTDTFSSQPYEQLAAVFRGRGLKEEAQQVMIEKNKEHGRYLKKHGRHLRAPNWRPLTWLDWFSGLWQFFWYHVFGNALVGYGYRPGRAFGWSLLVIVIGYAFFELGYDSELITPTKAEAYLLEKDGTKRLKNGKPQISENYPKFNSFVYSLETFVPLLKLGMSEYWTPNAKRGAPLDFCALNKLFPRTWGSAIRDYMWLHIILGWVLTTLWIGALAGLVKT
jgi:hypothetical protein